MKTPLAVLALLFAFATAFLSFYDLYEFLSPGDHAVTVTVLRRPVTRAPRIIEADYSNPYFTPHD